jgi:hypothetical protein
VPQAEFPPSIGRPRDRPQLTPQTQCQTLAVRSR